MKIRLLMGCLFASVLWAATMGYSSSDAEITDLAVIQREARITIPASASNVRCATDAVHRGPNVATYGRFDIPKADLQVVLAKMPVGEKVRPYEGYSNVTSHKMNQEWWQPESLEGKQTADWSMPGYSVNLLFGDGTEKDRVTVYFFNFSL